MCSYFCHPILQCWLSSFHFQKQCSQCKFKHVIIDNHWHRNALIKFTNVLNQRCCHTGPCSAKFQGWNSLWFVRESFASGSSWSCVCCIDKQLAGWFEWGFCLRKLIRSIQISNMLQMHKTNSLWFICKEKDVLGVLIVFGCGFRFTMKWSDEGKFGVSLSTFTCTQMVC